MDSVGYSVGMLESGLMFIGILMLFIGILQHEVYWLSLGFLLDFT